MNGDAKKFEAFANSAQGRAIFGLLVGTPMQDNAQALFVDDATTDPWLLDLTPEHFRTVCRAGQGPKTCRYAAHTLQGIMCAKATPAIKAAVDARAPTMRSKGDNCEGRKGFIPSTTPFG